MNTICKNSTSYNVTWNVCEYPCMRISMYVNIRVLKFSCTFLKLHISSNNLAYRQASKYKNSCWVHKHTKADSGKFKTLFLSKDYACKQEQRGWTTTELNAVGFQLSGLIWTKRHLHNLGFYRKEWSWIVLWHPSILTYFLCIWTKLFFLLT